MAAKKTAAEFRAAFTARIVFSSRFFLLIQV